MNSKIFFTTLLLLVVTGFVASRQCYKCTACPKPFTGNEDGVSKIDVGDNDYCQKLIVLGVENRDTAGETCTPINEQKYCCQGNLCNGSIAVKFDVKMLAAISALIFIIRFFQ